MSLSITALDTDAIVNPANSSMLMGGGLSKSIKEKGGQIIEDEAVRYAPLAVGKASITTAGRLKCKYVIHAPTMKEPAEKTGTENVAFAMKAILECAEQNKISEIAVPGLGTGVGKVPYKDAAEAMVKKIKTFKARNLKRVILVAKDETLFLSFKQALKD